MNKAIKNRDNLLTHIMDKFPFEDTADAGVYYDKELKAEMTVAGNQVSFKFPHCLTINVTNRNPVAS
jgi:hypothetical protein